jgi:hypothetical protein
MISMSKSPTNEALHAVVIVAFDTTSGRVHGTFVHGSYGGPDTAGIRHSRERFLSELRDRLDSSVTLDAIEHPLPAVGAGWIEQVDPKTRKPVIRHSTRVP